MSFEQLRAESQELDNEPTIDESTEVESQEDHTPEGEVEPQPEPEGDVENEPEGYTPNFEYEVKGEKREFPDWLRAAITSKEIEDQVRDNWTKLDGFESIKESRTKIEEDFNQYKQGIEPTISTIKQFDTHIAQGNLGEAFKMAGIDETAVIEHFLADETRLGALEMRLRDFYQLQEAGPQAQQAYQQSHQATMENKRLSQQLQESNQQLETFRQQQVESTLDNALSGHQELVARYDAANGPGAFKSFVKQYGDTQWHVGNRMAPDQLVEAVVKSFSPFMNPAQQPTNNNIQQPAPVEQKAPAQPAPTLPNVPTGSNMSNVGKQPKTMDEYRRMLSEVEA